eukprot:TRINITY_DN10564_c0_g1_i3.p3 TRINITY_DN10564_c0_g1~~TRINITY_DN10564_c0_g1_i3.p3  ORF type:complete len:163 (+),score=43.58 TRINITY_DN10564_c0_g1_i3:2-490(+)
MSSAASYVYKRQYQRRVHGDAYRDPAGRGLFDAGLDREKHGSSGPLAHCATVDEIERFPWPDPDCLNFDSCLRDLRAAGDVYRLSGFWTCYYHNVADLFGMEQYFIKMHTDPVVVRAVTDRVCEFYYEANERFFAAAGDLEKKKKKKKKKKKTGKNPTLKQK